MSPAPPFNPRSAARKLLREARSGALATLMPARGDPYCSLVNVATLADGAPILLLSRLALHTRNLLQDPRVSLLLDERKEGDPLEGARVMLQGTVTASTDGQVRPRYLARHPEAEMFVDFADFGFYRMTLEGAHLVAGFGRIVDLGASDILLDLDGASALLDAEPAIIAHMNEDHAEAVRLYARVLLNAPDGAWRCVGCDPEGLDLQLGRAGLRLSFPHPVTTPAALRETLKRLAGEARGAP